MQVRVRSMGCLLPFCDWHGILVHGSGMESKFYLNASSRSSPTLMGFKSSYFKVFCHF